MHESTTHLLDLVDKSVLKEIQSTFSRKHNVGLCIYDDSSNILTSMTDHFPAISNLNKEQRTFFNILYAVEHIDTDFVFTDQQPLYQGFLNGLITRAVFPLLFQSEMLGFVCLLKLHRALNPDKNADTLTLLEHTFNGEQDIDSIRDYSTPTNIELSLLVEEFNNLIHLLFEAGHVRSKYVEVSEPHEPEETALLFCTPDGVIVDTQEGTNALLGLKKNDNLVGKNLISDLTADTDDQEKIKEIISSQNEMEWTSLTLRTPDDCFILADINLIPQKDGEATVGYECYLKIRQKETIEEQNDDKSALGVIANHMLHEEKTSMNELVDNYKETVPEPNDTDEPDILSVDRLNKPGVFSYSFKGVSQLMDAVPFPILVVDSRDRIRIWNQSVEKLLHISADSMLDSEFSNLIVDEMQSEWREWCRILLNQDEAEYTPDSQLLIISKKADIITVSPHLSRNKIMGEEYISIVLQPETCERNAVPDPEFVHDDCLLLNLKHQFSSISAFIIENLKYFPGDLNLNPKQKKSLNLLKSLAHILLDSSHKIESFSGEIQLEKRPVNIKHLIESIRNKLERFLPEDIDILLNLDTQIPHVSLDQFRIVHVLGSLCKNAVDAMPGGGTIRIEAFATDTELFIKVIDSGQGIDASIRDRLFEPFSTTKPGIAKGLTFPSIKGIMCAHQGKIDINSSRNGCTVTLTFPIQTDKGLAPVSPAESVKTGVLVVDDDEGIAETSSTALKHYGFQSFKCIAPEDAVQILEANTDLIQLAVIDNHLEKCSGLECARELLQIKPSLDFIFTSGAPADSELSRYIETHSFGWLQKPYTMNTLVDKVKSITSE